MKKLNEKGVGQLFPPGTDTKQIVEYITNYVKEHRKF
jgi:methylmalonyl-CoA mutase C-terminal domain/subunit